MHPFLIEKWQIILGLKIVVKILDNINTQLNKINNLLGAARFRHFSAEMLCVISLGLTLTQ